MKTQVRLLVVAVLVGGMVWGAGAQTPITVTSSEISMGLTATPQMRLQVGLGYGSLVNLNSNYITIAALQQMSLSAPAGLSINSNLVTNNGHLLVTGNLSFDGSIYGVIPKNFIHPHPTDDSKVIRYAAIESSEALTLARGVAKTVNGEVTIALPEHFSMVTCKDEPISVIVTPKGAPALLYTKQESREKIVVAMKESDFVEFKDVEFSYQVTGVRDGFEKVETIISIDDLDKTTPAREDVQKRIDVLSEKIKEKNEVKGKE
jgi:hypothetical protein